MCTNRELIESMECYMESLIDSFQDFVRKSLVMMSVGACTVIALLIYVVKLLSERGVPELNNNTSSVSSPSSNTRISRTSISKFGTEVLKDSQNLSRDARSISKDARNLAKDARNHSKDGLIISKDDSNNVLNDDQNLLNDNSNLQKVGSSNIVNNIPHIPNVSPKRRSDFSIKCRDNKACASVNCNLPMTASQDERVMRDFRFNCCSRDSEMKNRACVGTSARISIPSLQTFVPIYSPKPHAAHPKECSRNPTRASCCSLCCDDDKEHNC